MMLHRQPQITMRYPIVPFVWREPMLLQRGYPFARDAQLELSLQIRVLQSICTYRPHYASLASRDNIQALEVASALDAIRDSIQAQLGLPTALAAQLEFSRTQARAAVVLTARRENIKTRRDRTVASAVYRARFPYLVLACAFFARRGSTKHRPAPRRVFYAPQECSQRQQGQVQIHVGIVRQGCTP